MFALSRPILYSFVSRTPDSDTAVAALRVAFDFAMIFHYPINEFRNLFVTFGRENLPQLRRFMLRVLIAVTVLMVAVVASPVSTWIFRDLLAVKGQVLEMAIRAMRVLCVVPLIVAVRNYFHGLSLIARRTGCMAVAGICRNFAIYFLAGWGYLGGWLGPVEAVTILIVGFLTETLVVFLLRAPHTSEA